jgi:hypothetical protein
MPVPRTWLPRAQEILTILRGMPDDELDRAAIERLFQIQRRTALLVIHAVGPLLSGCSFKVDRKDLITWVEKIDATEGQELERRRRVKERIDQESAQYIAMRKALTAAGKPAMEFPVAREVMEATVASLPLGVYLHPGRVVLDFPCGDALQAVQLLYALGKAIANDFDSFEEAVSGT